MSVPSLSTFNTDAWVGRNLDEVATPALCLDMDRFEENVSRVVELCRNYGVQWRPHAKCHKSPRLAQLMMQQGAMGVTCATLEEAQLMVDGGISNVLIANMIASRPKLDQLAELAKRSQILVCVDAAQHITDLNQAMQAVGRTIGVLIELEIGFNRVGAASIEAAIALAKLCAESEYVELQGVMAYEGHLLTLADLDQKDREIQTAIEHTVSVRRAIEIAGYPCPIVSCGGTGSLPITIAQPGVTEIQAGGAVFMDEFYRRACGIQDFENALTVRATVVSRPTADRVVIDAGRKALDLAIHQPRPISPLGLQVEWFAAEHGILSCDPRADSPRIGDPVILIPGYADLTNNLYSRFWGHRGERIVDVFPIHHAR